MPRIPSTAFCRRPARSWRWNFRKTSASIPVSQAGGEVSPYYDAMIAKLIAHARYARSRNRQARSRACADADRRPAQQSGVSRQNSAGRANFGRARSIPASSIAILQRSARCRSRWTKPPRRAASRICSLRSTTRHRAPKTRHRIRRLSRLLGTRATASSSAARASVTLADRGRRRERDGDHQIWRLGGGRSRSTACRRRATPGCSSVHGEAYVLRDGRQTRVHLKDFSASRGRRRQSRWRDHGADARQGVGNPGSAWGSRHGRPTSCRD